MSSPEPDLTAEVSPKRSTEPSAPKKPKEVAPIVKYVRRAGQWFGSHVTDVATVVLALATTALAYCTHQDAGEQAGISNRLLDQMRAEQRPQVYAQFTPTESLSYDVNGASISLATIYRNTGHTLAQNVAGHFSAFLEGQQDYETVLGMTCDIARKNGEIMGFPLFPGTSVEGQISNSITQDELNKKIGSNKVYLSPIVVTCVAYRIPDDPKFHFTVFTYRLSMLSDRAIDREDTTIPAGNLRLRLYPRFRSFAN